MSYAKQNIGRLTSIAHIRPVHSHHLTIGWLCQVRASVASHFWFSVWARATRPRCTFSRISAAVAVHSKGLGSALCAAR